MMSVATSNRPKLAVQIDNFGLSAMPLYAVVVRLPDCGPIISDCFPSRRDAKLTADMWKGRKSPAKGTATKGAATKGTKAPTAFVRRIKSICLAR
jgi:hypothetical protein